MEIISYVGFNNGSYRKKTSPLPGKLLSFLNSNDKRKKKQCNHYDYLRTGVSGIAKEKAVAARCVKTHVSFKDILISAGRFESLLWKHRKLLLVSIVAAVSTFFLYYASLELISSKMQKVNALSFESGETDEIEMLNKLMETFANNESVDYFSDGTLVDAPLDCNVSDIFTQPVTFKTYKVQNGDTISGITKKFGLNNISTVIAMNDIDNVRLLSSGQKLKIPSIDGLCYTVQKGNSLAGLSAKFGVSVEELLDVNELETSSLSVGQVLFIPGARMDSNKLQQALGELFKCPISNKYRLSSYFGPRADPFTGAKSNHTGVDMACPTGTPILASSSGKVAFVGWSNVFGNYVIINHSNGYQTLYGHMSKIIATKGQWVSQGTRIGLVGSTGYSTGPHLHFTIYKNGKLVDPLSLIK